MQGFFARPKKNEDGSTNLMYHSSDLRHSGSNLAGYGSAGFLARKILTGKAGFTR